MNLRMNNPALFWAEHAVSLTGPDWYSQDKQVACALRYDAITSVVVADDAGFCVLVNSSNVELILAFWDNTTVGNDEAHQAKCMWFYQRLLRAIGGEPV